MVELNKNELTEISGGLDPVSLTLLFFAAAEACVQIIEHCYEVGKD